MKDTSPEAAAIQARITRRLTGAERLHLAFEMSELARDLAAARLRKEHPEWTEAEIKRELIRCSFGSEPLPSGLRRALEDMVISNMEQGK